MRRLRVWADLIKFSHSIFALPFALSMFIVVAIDSTVTLKQLCWIIVALVSARTAAMGFNRLLDRHIDAANPRTAGREVPASKVSLGGVVNLIIISTAVFLLSAWQLGRHCLLLAVPVIGFLFFYSYTKRFTSYSHLVLGAALALAPGGVWYALTAEFAFLPVIMMAAVMFWVAGFDIIYSCQDLDFDRARSLYSIPALVGADRALQISKLFHLVSLALLVYFGITAEYGTLYFSGVLIFGFFLFSQHRMISAADLSRADAAFFTRNAAASFVYFLGMLGEYFVS